jgi:hypothetical protein
MEIKRKLPRVQAHCGELCLTEEVWRSLNQISEVIEEKELAGKIHH